MNERSKKIRQLIEESGLSYVELEEKTGVKKSSLQRYASGTTTKIPLPAIESIAAAFGVNPNYILGWDIEDGEEKPTTETGSGLSQKKKEFVERVMQMSDAELDKLDQILRLVESTK